MSKVLAAGLLLLPACSDTPSEDVADASASSADDDTRGGDTEDTDGTEDTETAGEDTEDTEDTETAGEDTEDTETAGEDTETAGEDPQPSAACETCTDGSTQQLLDSCRPTEAACELRLVCPAGDEDCLYTGSAALQFEDADAFACALAHLAGEREGGIVFAIDPGNVASSEGEIIRVTDNEALVWRTDFEDLHRSESGVQHTAIPNIEVLEACAAQPNDESKMACLYEALIAGVHNQCTPPEEWDDDV